MEKIIWISTSGTKSEAFAEHLVGKDADGKDVWTRWSASSLTQQLIDGIAELS